MFLGTAGTDATFPRHCRAMARLGGRVECVSDLGCVGFPVLVYRGVLKVLIIFINFFLDNGRSVAVHLQMYKTVPRLLGRGFLFCAPL